MRPALLTMLGLVILALSAAPVPAQEKGSPLPSHMPLGKEVCYGRTYDRNHLASHPRQRVTSFHLFRDFTPNESAESPSYSAGNLREADGDGGIIVSAYVRFRNRPGIFWNGLNCTRTESGTVRCGIDCDGGGFALRGRGETLLVENEGFVVVGGCGASEEDSAQADFVAPGADDKVFRLDPKPVAECRALEDARRPAWAKLGSPLRVRLDTSDPVCFARHYDDAHLAKHPRQTVRRIAVRKAAGKRLDPGEFPSYELTFRIELKSGGHFERKIACHAEQYAFLCTNDTATDGPREFFLSRAGDGHVMLRDRRGVMQTMFDTTLGSDDRLFRLEQASDGACNF